MVLAIEAPDGHRGTRAPTLRRSDASVGLAAPVKG